MHAFNNIATSVLTRRSKLTADCYKGVCACGDHAWADVRNGYVALVDAEDADLLRDHHWRSFMPHRTVYALGRKSDGSGLLLHRALLGESDPAVIVDHKEGNGLDNRRRMLASTTTIGNSHSFRRKSTRNTSGETGVFFKKSTRRWTAAIGVHGIQIWLGSFDSKEAAKSAYARARKTHHGQ